MSSRAGRASLTRILYLISELFENVPSLRVLQLWNTACQVSWSLSCDNRPPRTLYCWFSILFHRFAKQLKSTNPAVLTLRLRGFKVHGVDRCNAHPLAARCLSKPTPQRHRAPCFLWLQDIFDEELRSSIAENFRQECSLLLGSS